MAVSVFWTCRELWRSRPCISQEADLGINLSLQSRSAAMQFIDRIIVYRLTEKTPARSKHIIGLSHFHVRLSRHI